MAGEPRDFQQIFTEFYPKIVAYLRRVVGDVEAEDVAQEVFVKINQALDGFRGESSLSTWIYRIATNAAMDLLRKPTAQQARQQAGNFATEDASDDHIARIDHAPLHDTLLIRKDMGECIRGLVNKLPDNYRTVLVLSDLEGLTNAEIGAVLGLSLDAVKVRLHRARLALKKSMNHACILYRDERNELSCDRKRSSLILRNK